MTARSTATLIAALVAVGLIVATSAQVPPTTSATWISTTPVPKYQISTVTEIGFSSSNPVFTPNGNMYVLRDGGETICEYVGAASKPSSYFFTVAEGRCGTLTYPPGPGIARSGNKLLVSKGGRVFTSLGREVDLQTFVATPRWHFAFAGPISYYHAVDPRDGAFYFGGDGLYRVPNPDDYTGLRTYSDPTAIVVLPSISVGAMATLADATLFAAIGTGLWVFNPYSGSGQLTIARKINTVNYQNGYDLALCGTDASSFFGIINTPNPASMYLTEFGFNIDASGAWTVTEGQATQPLVESWHLADVDPNGCYWANSHSNRERLLRLSNRDGSCMKCRPSFSTACSTPGKKCKSLSAVMSGL